MIIHDQTGRGPKIRLPAVPDLTRPIFLQLRPVTRQQDRGPCTADRLLALIVLNGEYTTLIV